MKREEKHIFRRVLLVIVVIFFINAGMFMFKFGNFGKGLTGFSVSETISSAINETPAYSKIFLVAQWGILVAVLIFSFVKDRSNEDVDEEISEIKVKSLYKKNSTDLDALYTLLKNKKKLKISAISKFFNIEEGTAMEWCRTLESGDLASIEYPIGGPVIKIN